MTEKEKNIYRKPHDHPIRYHNLIRVSSCWFALNFFLLFFLSSLCYAQDNGSYLIPRYIFVGDPATLVLPLPAAAQNRVDIVLTSPSDYLPSDPNIDFHRIILEQRITGSRLLIEFTPFVPGILELPVIEIGDAYFSGLTVTVNSLIDDSASPVLSGAASTLAIPGTAFMLYGSLTAIIFIILFAFIFILKGRKFLNELTRKIKQRRLFKSIYKTEKRLQKEIIRGTDKRLVLDKLSEEFRLFLSTLTGNNCRAMTAGEFDNLTTNTGNTLIQEEKPSFLNVFFRECDDLRFSGKEITSGDLTRLLDDMRGFLSVLENISEKELSKEETS